jgi:hypothetical protein
MFGVTNDRQCRRDLRKQGGDSHGRISQRQQINKRLTWYFYTHLITRLLYNAAVQLKAIFGINSPFQRLLFDERKWFSVVSIRGGGGGCLACEGDAMHGRAGRGNLEFKLHDNCWGRHRSIRPATKYSSRSTTTIPYWKNDCPLGEAFQGTGQIDDTTSYLAVEDTDT